MAYISSGTVLKQSNFTKWLTQQFNGVSKLMQEKLGNHH